MEDRSMFLTIQQFSEKTGLSTSALRFYDRKKLLVPESRLANGYRAYSDTQIADALMIHSLRNADIQINEIKSFLVASECDKDKFIFKWRQEVKAKLSALKIAQQYLGGLSPKQNHIHLIRWDEQVHFIWLKHTVKRKLRPFHEVAVLDQKKLMEAGYALGSGFYVRQQDSKGNELSGEVGFIIHRDPIHSLADNEYIEELEPTLFASMECSTDNEFLCFQFIQMIRQYGFLPNGQKLEKYESYEDNTFQYLIPIRIN